MIALNSGFLDRSVHALDLAVRPWMLDLGQPMFDVIFLAAHIEHMRHVSCRRAIRVARRESELDLFVGVRRVDLAGIRRYQSCEEHLGGGPSCLNQSHKGELAGT